jgi:nucleoid-associated protein YgaU
LQRAVPRHGRFLMASSVLDASTSLSRSIARSARRGSLRLCVPAVLIFSFAVVGPVQCRAQDQKDQDVAEAARQERTRKQSQPKKSKHVYTAEDLKREHILTPEDRAQLEARKNQTAPAGSQKPQDAIEGSAVARDGGAEPSANAPLGDVARRLRKQKESQHLQHSTEFHLPFADAPVLASPKPPVQPLRPPITVVKPAPPVVAPFPPLVKRSPFERPRILPPAPSSAAPHGTSPALHSPRVLPTPPAPRVSPTPPPARVVPLESARLTIVTIKPGDSLWKFAAARLGDGRRWHELLSLNPGLRNPDVIQVGAQVILPASVASPRAPTKYTVRHGDTLWSLAQNQFGHGSSWSCISQANPDLRDANLIREGQILLLPGSCPR